MPYKFDALTIDDTALRARQLGNNEGVVFG
jgi:hypothetical protein